MSDNSTQTTSSDEHSPPSSSAGSPLQPSSAVCWAAHVSGAAVVMWALKLLAPGLLKALDARDWTSAGAFVAVIALVTSPTGLKDVMALLRLVRKS